MHHLRKLKDDLMIASAQLSRREDKITAAEARMMINKTESAAQKSAQMDIELAAVRSVVSEVMLANFVNSVEESICAALSSLNDREEFVAEMEEKMLEERRSLNDGQARLAQQQLELDAYLASERDFLKREKEKIAKDQADLSSAMAEEKSRDEERDMYAKLIHDLEASDERARRHLKAIEDELDVRRLRMDMEQDELQKNSAELLRQDALYKAAMAQLSQDNAQLTAEKQNVALHISRLSDREQSLNERAEELEKESERIRFDRSRLFREQQTMNDSIAHNETIKREGEIDGIRNQAIATKTLQLKAEVDSATTMMKDREAYLESWETELTNREEEYSRLVEQAISIPKLHQFSSDYQNVSSGVVKMQSRLLKEHYLAGQQRRVFSASLKRGALSSGGNENAYSVGLRTMGGGRRRSAASTVMRDSTTPVRKLSRVSESASVAQHPLEQTNLKMDNTADEGVASHEDDYDDIRVDDAGSESGEDAYASDEFNDSPAKASNERTRHKKSKRESRRRGSGSESDNRPTSRSSRGSSVGSAASKSDASSRSRSTSISSSAPSPSADCDDGKQPSADASVPAAAAPSTTPILPTSGPSTGRALLPPMSRPPTSQLPPPSGSIERLGGANRLGSSKQSHRPSTSSSSHAHASSTFNNRLSSTSNGNPTKGSVKNTAVENEAALATSSRICSLTHTVTELQRTFRRYAARANLLVADRDNEKTDRFYQRVTPTQRSDIETAIWSERLMARDIGIRRHFSNCPVVVDKEFTNNPAEMVRRVASWWVGVEESLQHSDERALQDRMDLLGRAVDGLSSALDRSDAFGQRGEVVRNPPLSHADFDSGDEAKKDKFSSQIKASDDRRSAPAAAADWNLSIAAGNPIGTSFGGIGIGGIASSTLSARRAIRHSQNRPSTAGPTMTSRQ